MTDSRVPVQDLPPDVHRELLEGLVAVGDQVVLAQTGELVDIAVKRLVVSSAPRGAGAADVAVT